MLNTPRKEIVRSMLAQGTLAALLGMTLGCGANSPAAPTPEPVTSDTALPTPTGVHTVTASTNMVSPGGELSVSWTTSLEWHNDYIVLFKKGDLNTGHAWWLGWTDGATSGTFTLSAPSEAGQYEFRYLLDDGYEAGAVSSPLTVAVGA